MFDSDFGLSISASSWEQNLSAHSVSHWHMPHIYRKFSNRLDPAHTEKLVYVYLNSKMVTGTRETDQLEIFAWDDEDV